MIITTSQVKALMVSVVGVRIIALFLTFYAITEYPRRFYESNPVTNPVFGSFGSLGGTIFYTVILLVAMVLIYDSVAKTHPRYYKVVFVMYTVILFISLLDLANDVIAVGSAA